MVKTINASGAKYSNALLNMEDVVIVLQQMNERITELETRVESLERQTRESAGSDTKRRRGRPQATEKSFAHYVCPDRSTEDVRAAFVAALRQTGGTARAVALLEKQFIDEGKIAGIIPWKLLKKEFGELVTFGRTRFDDMIRLYELRQ